MKSNLMLMAFIFMSSFLLTSCQAIGDIFSAGMWAGVVIVVLIIALVLWLIGKARR